MSNHTKKVYNIQGKVCGVIEGEILRRKIRENHILRQPPALCFDSAIIEEAEAFGVKDVEVTSVDDGKVYRTPLSAFREHGFNFNRGFGLQIGLVLSRWEVNGQPPAYFEKPKREYQPPKDFQLPLGAL